MDLHRTRFLAIIRERTFTKGGGEMSRDAYELLALGARYVFAGLMVLIALRG